MKSMSMTFGEYWPSPVTLGAVLRDVVGRREEQIGKGYDATHDDDRGAKHLLAIADKYRFPLEELSVDDVDRDVLRNALIDQMATLSAVVEYIDRERVRLSGES